MMNALTAARKQMVLVKSLDSSDALQFLGRTLVPGIPRYVWQLPRDFCNNSRCVLSLLRPSVRVPGSMSLQIKKLIWEYAGVRSGPKWDVIDGADTNI